MSVKVIYTRYKNIKKFISDSNDYFILSEDNWDDFHYRTSFNVHIIKNNELYSDNSTRKVLFKNQEEKEYSFARFNAYMKSNQVDFVDIKEFKSEDKFISLGNDYEEIKKIFVENEIIDNILKILNDIVYLRKNTNDIDNLLEIEKHPAFEISLCRGQSSKKLLTEAKSILYGDELSPERFKIDFSFKLNEKKYAYKFDFIDNLLPNRINVLIGKNGVGKSQTLKVISNYLINPSFFSEEYEIDTSNHPNFISNLIVFAYNAYEDFHVPKSHDNFNTSIVYKYNGFRKYENNTLLLDINTPVLQTYNSLKDIYKKDSNNFKNSIKLYDEYLLKKAFFFIKSAISNLKYLALKFETSTVPNKYIENDEIKIISDDNLYEYFVIDLSNDIKLIDIDFSYFAEEVYFISDFEEVLHLSSGQRIFCNLVINLLAIIKNNSLVIIDEPETALHPNLELDFMKLLKDILDEFDSFAIIATHSAIITREIPAKYVHIINLDGNNQPIVSKPTINTFGGDIGTITNYVFNDIFISNKPHYDWLKKQKDSLQTLDAFINIFKNELSYDFLTKCINIWDEV